MTNPDDIAALNQRITMLIHQHLGAPAGTHIPPSCSDVYDAVMRQGESSSEGGKRLRACLMLAVYDAVHEAPVAERDAAIDLACAIEVFQTAALIHDDIIDNSDLRRGKPAAHVALSTALDHMTTGHGAIESLGSAVEHISHIGAGLGIMLGDLLSTASIDIAHAAAHRLQHPDRIVEAFVQMHREVEIGQILDLAVEHVSLDNPEALAQASLAVFRWKTASYTTIAPISLGLLAAGASTATTLAGNAVSSTPDIALKIGTALGTAFQLADDLLDVIGDPAHSGKPTGGDIREGKRTVLLADALAMAPHNERGYLVTAFSAASRDEATVREITRIFKQSGAVDHSRQRIKALWEQTQETIVQASTMMSVTSDARDSLLQCCALFIPQNLR